MNTNAQRLTEKRKAAIAGAAGTPGIKRSKPDNR